MGICSGKSFALSQSTWLRCVVASLLLLSGSIGCKSAQFGRVMDPKEPGMVGSHRAGQETFTPLVDEAVAKLLARHEPSNYSLPTGPGEVLPPPQKRVCFVGVENRTSEDLGDFKEQVYEMIDGRLLQASVFSPISRRYVDAGLKSARLRPDELFVPGNMRTFVQLMEQQGQPFDYLLFAKVTSGTTQDNRDYQRDYLLTLELVDIQTGDHDKQAATLSKGYHHSRVSRAASKIWPWK